MVLSEEKYVLALRRVLKRLDYAFLIKSMRGVGDWLDPWYDYATMEYCINNSTSPYKRALALLQMGVEAEYGELKSEIGDDADIIIEAGIWRREDGKVKTNNLVVLTYQGITLLTEINPWFTTCQNRNTDVYIGSDSLRLAENIVFDKGASVLDICSGTGIQGILAARSAKKVVSIEINPKATPVTRFNIALNGMGDVMELREGDLYAELKDGEKFDYIYANPPFIPMPDDVNYPVCGSGGEDGLTVLNRIFDGLSSRLNEGGEAIIFCECLGNARGVFFDWRVDELARANGWRVNALYNNRLAGDLQILKMAKLAALFDEGFEEEPFCERMTNVYEKLGAEYLYSMLYKIDACGEFSFRRTKRFNPWDRHDGAVVNDITLTENADSRAVMQGGSQIGAFNNETVDIVSALKKGASVERAAKELWPKYRGKDKYAEYGYPAFVNAMLATCLKTQNIGAMVRKVGNE